MTTYEYKVENKFLDCSADLVNYLNDTATHGWRLITVRPYTNAESWGKYIFEREINNNSSNNAGWPSNRDD